jgi:hypothetical protein
MKHLKHAYETLAETLAKTPKKHLNPLQHLKPVKKYACNMHVYATFKYTFITSR